ncbi:MAG TPA: sigma-70 family RNA polymerase sigma factor [Opitutaceae bacterium]|nr:sigma-70 family RNA polymerase sigma factor [Opitutaceae bacterium]
MIDDDAQLLNAYVRDRSETAFGELVQRHLTLVYSAALRQTGGDAHRARDVAQIVFTALARDAAALSRHPALTGWLYTATRHAAIDLMRAERRRQKREEEAMTMEQISAAPEPVADWEQLRPVLDDAMEELGEKDREAVLLRFFEDRPFAGVAAVLRVSEEAARKRVDRALERLGGLLAQRGITSTGAALAALLANQAVAAPAGTAASIAAAALAGTAAGGFGAAGIFIMSTTKTVTAITAAIALAAIGTALYQAKLARESEAALAALRGERANLSANLATLDQRARQSDEALAATRKELADLRASAAKPAPAADTTTGTPGSQGAAMDYLLEHPEMHAAFLQQLELRSKMRYDRFYKTANLSPEQQDQLTKIFDDVQAAQIDLMAALHARGYGVGNMPQDPEGQQMLQKMATEMRQHLETGLKSTLGEDGYKSFQQYSALISERNVADQLASQLYYTSDPLTPSQADQLVQVLAQNRFAPQREPSPSATMNGTFIDPQSYSRRIAQEMQQNGMNMLNWSAPVTDTALSRAESVLTPAQIAALRQVQAQQALQFQLAPPPAGQKASAAENK